MKKLSIALAVAGTFAAASASAMTVGTYDVGCLVPVAHFDATTDTVVGLTSRAVDTSATTTAEQVYWTFFDVNSNHIADGTFPMTSNDQYGFSLKAQNRTGTSGVPGYLVFTLGVKTSNIPTTVSGHQIACNTFQISANDAAFIPTPPLANSSYTFSAPAGANLSVMNKFNNLGPAIGMVSAGTTVDMRYWIDGTTGGRDTAVLVWSPGDMNGTYSVNIYDDAQNFGSGNFALPNAELNIFNPETMLGRPATYLDGFIKWTVPTPSGVTASGASTTDTAPGVFTFSVVTDPAFGATQTLTNPF